MKNRSVISLLVLCLALAGVAAVAAKLFAVDPAGCTNCGLCLEVCPVEAISVVEVEGKSVAAIDPELCTGCGLCEETCPVEAIAEVPAISEKPVATEVAE